MKNSLLLALMFAFALVSCKKKEKVDLNNPEKTIIGNWTLNKMDYLSMKDGVKYNDGSKVFATGSYVEFKSDRTFKLSSKDVSEDEFEVMTGHYTITDRVLSFVDPEDGWTETFNIVRLDAKNLVFEGKENYEYEGSDYEDTMTFHASR